MTDTCKRCGGPVDLQTREFFDRLRERRNLPPRETITCGGCLVLAIDEMFVGSGIDPLLPTRWKVVRP